MNKKIIAVAAVGIIAIGVYANSPFGEKVVFDNNPIVQTMQLKQQNQLDGVLSALKETGINPDDIKSGSQQVTPISWVGQNTSFQQTGKSLITICG